MNSQDFKRKLTAVFSADVAGYSRLMGEDEAATVKTLEAYKQIMFSLIKQHRGRVIDSPGDNLLAEFASVVDAVQCGVAIQKELHARNAELPENRKMQFRIGINLGDVIEEQDRIYGDGVNIAARLESCADPGGICVSKTAFDHIETKLPLGYEYLGEKEVKNIAKPVGAYRVLMEPRVTVAGAKEKKPSIPVWRTKGIFAGAVAVIIVIIGAAVWNFYLWTPKIEPASKEKMVYPLPDKPSIAVLPFVNMSSNPEYDSLADSLSENIIYTLSYLPGMFVIARNSTFSYKGKPVEIRQVAEQLGVRYILEGSVLRAEDRVRVTAQLIDATTGYHLWSGRFDRKLNDIFSLLDEITKNIAIELQVKVSPDQWAVLTHKTENFDAWAAATRAYSLLLLGAGEEAQKLAEKAVALDPQYGFGWAVLAALHTLKVYYGLSQSPADSIKLAAECNEKALTLDPTLSCATANRGQIYLLKGKIEDAIALGKKAIDMAPSLDANYMIFGMTLDFAGRFEEAIPLFKTAMRLNPFYPARYLKIYGMSCLMADRKEEALTAFKELLQRTQKGEFPPPLVSHIGLCAVYADLGRDLEAKTNLQEILKINPNFSLEDAKKVHRWKEPKNTERWVSSLRKAGIPEKPPLPLPDKPSIAVLPFTNMSEDPKQEYFCDGLAEEVINALARVPQVYVIARNSSFTYKGKAVDVKQVKREMGVKYVLEGSVRREEARVRITAQLVDATTGNHVFSERYDRDLKDIFALQDDITIRILTAIRVKLTEGEQARVRGKGTKDLEAYLGNLEARELAVRLNKEDNALARKKCEEVIALDPQYADAWVLLSTISLMNFQWGIEPERSLRKAHEAAQKAVSLDETLGSAHMQLGFLYAFTRRYEEGIAESERAVQLDPGSANVHANLGRVLEIAGQPKEALGHIEKAIRMNPIPPAWYWQHLGFAHMQLEQYEDAVVAFKKTLAIAPKHRHVLVGLISTYALMGRMDDARAVAQDILRADPRFNPGKGRLFHKDEAFNKRFAEGIEKAGLLKDASAN